MNKEQIEILNGKAIQFQDDMVTFEKLHSMAKDFIEKANVTLKYLRQETEIIRNAIPGSFYEIERFRSSEYDTYATEEAFRGNSISKGYRIFIEEFALLNAYNDVWPSLKALRDSLFIDDPDIQRAEASMSDPIIKDSLIGLTKVLEKSNRKEKLTVKEAKLVNTYNIALNRAKLDIGKKLGSKIWNDYLVARKQFNEKKDAVKIFESQNAQTIGGYGQRINGVLLPDNAPGNAKFVVRSIGSKNGTSYYGSVIGVLVKPGIYAVRLATKQDRETIACARPEFMKMKKKSDFKGKLDDFPPFVQFKYQIAPCANALRMSDTNEKGDVYSDGYIHAESPEEAMEKVKSAIMGYTAKALNPANASKSDYIKENLLPQHVEWMKQSYGGKTWDQIVEQAYKESLALGHLNNEKKRQALDAANAEALKKQALLNAKKAADPNYKPTAEELPDSNVMGDEYYNALASIVGLPKQKTWYNNAFKNWKALKNPDTGILEFLSDEDAKKYEQKQALDLERRRVQDQSKKKEDVIAKYNNFVDTIARQRDILKDDKASPLAKLIASRRLNKADKARRAFLQEYIFESGIDEERDEDDELIGGTLRIKDENGNYTHVLPPQAAYNIINKPTGDVYASVRSGMAKYMLHNGMLTDPESIPKPETEDDEALLDYYQDVIDANKDNISTLDKIYTKLWRKKDKTPADEKQLLSTYRTIAQLYELGDDYQSDVDTLTRQIKSKKTAFDSEKRHAERLKKRAAAQAIAGNYAEGQQDEDMFEDREAKIDEMIKRTQGDPAMQAYWQREKDNYSGRESNVKLLIDKYGNVIATTAAGKSGKSDAGMMLKDEAAANNPDTNIVGNLVKDAAHDAKKAGGKAKTAARNLKNAGKANNVKTTKNSNGSVTKETIIKPNNDNVNLGPMAEVVQQGMPGSRNDGPELSADDIMLKQLDDED